MILSRFCVLEKRCENTEVPKLKDWWRSEIENEADNIYFWFDEYHILSTVKAALEYSLEMTKIVRSFFVYSIFKSRIVANPK